MRRIAILALIVGAAGCLGGSVPPQQTPTPDPTPTDPNPVTTTTTPVPSAPSDPPTASANDQVVAFAKCMQQTDWDSSGMNDFQNQTTAGYGGECYSCHATGMFGTYLSPTSTDNLTHWKMEPWVLKFVTASTKTDGSFDDIVQTGRLSQRGQEAGHPAYALTSARQSALDNFFMLTYGHWKAGNCP